MMPSKDFKNLNNVRWVRIQPRTLYLHVDAAYLVFSFTCLSLCWWLIKQTYNMFSIAVQTYCQSLSQIISWCDHFYSCEYVSSLYFPIQFYFIQCLKCNLPKFRWFKPTQTVTVYWASKNRFRINFKRSAYDVTWRTYFKTSINTFCCSG